MTAVGLVFCLLYFFFETTNSIPVICLDGLIVFSPEALIRLPAKYPPVLSEGHSIYTMYILIQEIGVEFASRKTS
jgi:hypothetical protein